MNKVDNLIKFIDYIRKPRMRYLSNAMTVREIKEAEKAISELYKGIIYNDELFVKILRECFDDVKVDGTHISIGEYELHKTNTDVMSIKNLFTLTPMFSRVDNQELDKAIHNVISSALYTPDKESMYDAINKYTKIRMEVYPKICRFQELFIEGYTQSPRVKILARSNRGIHALITSLDGEEYKLSCDLAVIGLEKA